MSLPRYEPAPAPLAERQLPEYVLRELRRIAFTFQQYAEGIADAATGGGSASAVVVIHRRGAAWVRASGPIQTPVNEVRVYIEQPCVITGAQALGNVRGTCQVDVRRGAVANQSSISAGNSICGGDKISLSNTHAVVRGVTGWGVSLSTDDVLVLVLESTTLFSTMTVTLTLESQA